MLTQLAEGMREKCHQYFPDKVEDPPLEVILTDDEGKEVPGSVSCVECNFDEDSKTTVRKITLKRGEEEQKEVFHLFFLGWPDFGVPEESDREALLSMIALSRAKNQDSFAHPRTVHCSAGVGRTGTFIALEHLLTELENGVYDSISHRDQIDPIYSTIDQLREQRMTMVQSDAQYNFLYDIMREQYLKRIEEKKIPGEPSPKMLRTAKSFRAVFRRTLSGGLKKLADDNAKAGAAAAEESAEEGKAQT
jgi:protein-tyrosine phosphatase